MSEIENVEARLTDGPRLSDETLGRLLTDAEAGTPSVHPAQLLGLLWECQDSRTTLAETRDALDAIHRWAASATGAVMSTALSEIEATARAALQQIGAADAGEVRDE